MTPKGAHVRRSPKGVPAVKGLPGPAKPGLALGMGLVAAGVSGVAGFAAERLSRQRRQAIRLDEDLGQSPLLREESDADFMVLAPDGVELHVEVDFARPGELASAADPRTDDCAQMPAQVGATLDAAARPTVVLAHGYCLSSQCWIFQRRALRRAGYRVVMWDQRGHGRSGSGDPDSYRIDTLGADLAAVIDAAAPEGPIVLVGHSMGGMALMSYARSHPEQFARRVVGAALVATSAGGLNLVEYGLGKMTGSVVHRAAPGIARLLAGTPRVVDEAVRVGRDLVDFVVDWGSFGSPVPMSVARLTTDMIFGTDMEVVAEFMPRFDEHDMHAALEQFNGREVLVFNGTKDRLTPPAHSEELLRHMPAAEHVLVTGAGHVIMLEVPDLLNQALLELLANVQRTIRPDESMKSGPLAHVRARTAPHAVIDVRKAFENQWR